MDADQFLLILANYEPKKRGPINCSKKVYKYNEDKILTVEYSTIKETYEKEKIPRKRLIKYIENKTAYNGHKFSYNSPEK